MREVIHRFKDEGIASLEPRWAVCRPRRITTDDEDFIVESATTRPGAPRLPFTTLEHCASWPPISASVQTRVGKISAERLRQMTGGPGRDVPAHQDLEGVQRPRARRQAGPHRGRPWGFPAAVFRLRHSASRRRSAKVADPGWAACGGARGWRAANYRWAHGVATVPRLPLDRRGCPAGGRATAQVGCPTPWPRSGRSGPVHSVVRVGSM